MNSELVWKAIREAAQFKIDKVHEIIATEGEDEALDSFREALEEQDLKLAAFALLHLDGEYIEKIENCAFRMAALLLEMELNEINIIEKEGPIEGGLST
jgi:hypothetical protein